MRKRHDKAEKARIAIEAIKGEQTVQEIAMKYSVHPNQVTKWKHQLLEGRTLEHASSWHGTCVKRGVRRHSSSVVDEGVCSFVKIVSLATNRAPRHYGCSRELNADEESASPDGADKNGGTTDIRGYGKR